VLQQRLEQLKIRRITTTKWALMLAPLMWVPLLIVLLKGLAGIDAYSALGAVYLAVNALAGIAVIPLALWMSKRFGPHVSHSSFVRTLMDDLAGRSLLAALASLDTIRRFQEDG
jgi:hypothetical protein